MVICSAFLSVMPGLDPGIHTARQHALHFIMDCRVKPGNDK
jgi:hypothetical protein